jgi:hypothetical protein
VKLKPAAKNDSGPLPKVAVGTPIFNPLRLSKVTMGKFNKDPTQTQTNTALKEFWGNISLNRCPVFQKWQDI